MAEPGAGTSDLECVRAITANLLTVPHDDFGCGMVPHLNRQRMTSMTNGTKDVNNHELSLDELDNVEGGFWKELGGAILAGAATGGLGGSVVGGVGAVPGAIGGGLLGGIGYCISSLF